MKVKINVSAAGADFVLIFGQEMEFDEVKRLIGNGAENFCTPVDASLPWPPVAVVVEAEPEPVAEPEPETPAEAETPAEPAEDETAVAPPAVETAVKSRGRK